MCCSFCTHSLPRGGQQHLDNPSVCVSVGAYAHSCMLPHQISSPPGFPNCTGTKAHPKPCIALLLPVKHLSSYWKAPSIHLWDCPPTLVISQLHTTLWVCRCAPCVFAPLHAYLSTPACKYLHVVDLTYLVLFHAVPLHVFMTLKALISLAKLLRLHSLLCITMFFPSGLL